MLPLALYLGGDCCGPVSGSLATRCIGPFTASSTGYHLDCTACADDEYDCEDATCISLDLRCNGRVNCRFRWDEDECQVNTTNCSAHTQNDMFLGIMVVGPNSAIDLCDCPRICIRICNMNPLFPHPAYTLQTESAGQSDHVIIVIVVFTLILSTIFIAFIISCCQKLIRDHKIIRVSNDP